MTEKPEGALARFLQPRLRQRAPTEVFQVVGKGHAVVLILMLFGNLMEFLRNDGGRDAYLTWFHGINTPMVVMSVFAGLLMWRARLSYTWLRRLALVCYAGDVASLLFIVWGEPSSSWTTLLALLCVMVFRAAVDFRSAIAFAGLFLCGLWGLWAGQTLGLLSASTNPAATSRVLELPILHSAMLLAAFWGADILTSRLERSYTAVRLLQERLGNASISERTAIMATRLAGRYRILELLGRGAMAEVWAAHDNHENRPVAIKLLRSSLLEDATVVKRFRREARIVAELDSPHIVRVFDLGEVETGHFMVMEHLLGETLAARLAREGAMSATAVKDLVTQLARGLESAHGAGVVHRDLKPANVFLARNEDGGFSAKLLDFGISKIHGAATVLTHAVGLLGTPAFMAPEQATGGGDVDARADVFALACVAYTALAGKMPFTGASIPAVLFAVCQLEPTPVSTLQPGLPSDVDLALAKGMAKSRDQRFASVTEFAESLAAALAGTTVPARRPASVAAEALAETLLPEASTASGSPVAHTEGNENDENAMAEQRANRT